MNTEVNEKKIDQIFRDGAKVTRFIRETLTKREREVVELRGLGYNDKEVAVKMNLSYSTVQIMGARISEKMNDAGLCWGRMITVSPKKC